MSGEAKSPPTLQSIEYQVQTLMVPFLLNDMHMHPPTLQAKGS